MEEGIDSYVVEPNDGKGGGKGKVNFGGPFINRKKNVEAVNDVLCQSNHQRVKSKYRGADEISGGV